MKFRQLMKVSKGLVLGVVALAAFAVPQVAGAVEYSDKDLGSFITEVRAPLGSPVVVGEWNGDLDACRAKAEKEGIPMIAIWSFQGCAHCHTLERALKSDRFKEWAKTCGFILCFTCSYDPKGARSTGAYYSWCGRKGLSGSLSDYPYVRFYWYTNNGKTAKVDYAVVGDTLDKQQGIAYWTNPDGTREKNFNKAGQNCIDYIMNSSGFGAYVPKPAFNGGVFTVTNTVATACLQAEPATTFVNVEMTRETTDAATQKVVVTPSGKTAKTISVSWAKNETNKVVKLENFNTAFYTANTNVKLEAKDDENGTISTTIVACVPAQPNAPSNPYWIGEKTAGELAWGDWTMDLDAAKAKVATDPEAVMVGFVDGTLWCPWCKKGETWLTSEAFKAWAAEKKVIFVQVDCPRQNAEQNGPAEGPTLLRHTVATVSGAATSGSGYLSRKMIDPAAAEAVFARNIELVTATWRRPESAAWRTGMGTFILFDHDGTAKGRLVWNREAEGAEANMLRLAELETLLADANEEANQAWQTTSAEVPMSGTVTGNAISLCDLVDVFKLPASANGCFEEFTYTSEKAADVILEIVSVNGTAETVVATASGSKTVAVGGTITSETSYLRVRGNAETTFKGDHATSNPNDTLTAYTLVSAVVLVPQEKMGTYELPAGATAVTVQITQGELYRLDGVEGVAGKIVEDETLGKPYFRALVSENVQLPVAAGSIAVNFQNWKPGTVGFAVARATAKENAGTVKITLKRVGGASGEAALAVTLDETATAFLDSDGEKRYEDFAATTVTWADGDAADKTVEVKLLYAGARFDGNGTIVLKAAKSGECVAALGTDSFVLDVTEVDQAAPGVIGFVEAGAALVKEGQALTFNVSRTVASDGAVSATVKTTKGTLSSGTASWANHKFDTLPITLSGLRKGETATVTLTAPQGGATLGANKKLTVTAVDAAGAEFANPNQAETLVRYVAFSNVYALAEAPAKKPTFAKISGTLPAGLKVTYDAAAQGMAVWGIPSKAGTYEVVYQVKVGSAAGLAQRISFTVADATVATEGEPALNPAVAAVKSRTFTDLMVIDPENKALLGVMKVTIPATGKMSAKYTCATGSVSFTSKSWTAFDPETGALAARATGKYGYAIEVQANGDESVEGNLYQNGELIAAFSSNGTVWSKTKPATAFQGYYTVILPTAEVEEATAGVAPRGTGYLTLKMDSATTAQKGTVTWAGMLPNGTAVSGKSVLTDGGEWGFMPFFKASKTDVFAGALKILANACPPATATADQVAQAQHKCVFMMDEVVPLWQHIEKTAPLADYAVRFNLYGAFYHKQDSLLTCCKNAYDVSTLDFLVDGASVNKVNVKMASMALVNTTTATNPQRVSMTLKDTTGVITGSVRNADGTTCKYAGVVLLGWGGIDCGCFDTPEEFQPFAAGSYYYTKRETVGGKSLSLKRGGNVAIDNAAK